MKRDEYIHLRISELSARRNYAAQLVMNRDMAHEVKICDAQIIALTKELKGETESTVIENALPKIGPIEQVWCQGSNPQQLIHTDDHGADTVLCDDHTGETLSACKNCRPWPSLKNISTHNRNL